MHSDPPTVLLGTANGGPYSFLLQHVGLLAGIAMGSLLLALDARGGTRQQSLAFHPLHAGIVVPVLIVSTLALVGLRGDRLPAVLQHRERVVVEVTESLSVASGSVGGEGLERLRGAG